MHFGQASCIKCQRQDFPAAAAVFPIKRSKKISAEMTYYRDNIHIYYKMDFVP